jgi:hypothetical protein
MTTEANAETNATGLDGSMMTSLTAVAAVAVTLSLGALAIFGWSAALGVALGGLVATANLWVLAHIARGVLAEGGRRSLWAIAGAAKLLALLGGAWFLLRSGQVSGVALAAGYAALPAGITLASLTAPRGAPRKRLASRKGTW